VRTLRKPVRAASVVAECAFGRISFWGNVETLFNAHSTSMRRFPYVGVDDGDPVGSFSEISIPTTDPQTPAVPLRRRPRGRSRWPASKSVSVAAKGPGGPEARRLPLSHRHGVPAFRAVPAHDGAAERHGGSGHGERWTDLPRQSWRAGLSPKSVSPARKELPGPALGRAAATRRHRPRLAMSPEVMLFDEAPRHSIPSWSARCLAVMPAARRRRHHMIVVTHEIAFARDIARPCPVHGRRGIIAEHGPADEILVRPANPRTRAPQPLPSCGRMRPA